MKYFFLLILFFFFNLSTAKEWKNLKEFQDETGKVKLLASDWLHSDRKSNSLNWQQANSYNLENNLSLEYETIQQRTDFYLWLLTSLELKKSEVVWPKMAHFISNKLEKIKSFPFNIFTRKEVKIYATKGSETVFTKAFDRINTIYFLDSVLKSDEALNWDKAIIYEEQYVWLQGIYSEIDEKTLKTIDKMAKGKGVYRLIVPKEIVFSGDLSNEENRYNYALNTLRVYFQTASQ
ncbi:Insecticidal toxin complex protein [Bizionia arctica]|uniref:Insecticidal toxin complex protein n=1 Tax=Bizionia arctica TaxID=1495645 RepID=A0A917GX29_9FLAO|nr:Insecticidal toxin complex protein [Bizionia arctica]GGG59666.1 hypothetical protein GCM10010976_33020 [Bizionia arctica]